MNTHLAGARNELRRVHARGIPSATAVESVDRGEWEGTLPKGSWRLTKNSATSFNVETNVF